MYTAAPAKRAVATTAKYSEGNLLCDFDAGLLSRLADHHIGLKLDFYGGPENVAGEQ